MKAKYLLLAIVIISSCTTRPEPPKSVFPVPSSAQLAWQELEYYAFVHFNMNTFTNMEWGTGGESPSQFNPTELDCRQWAKVCKEAGMKGIILTAKHHDGFCLWPTETTEHSVKNSPWKDGKGDVLKELSEACKAYGLKFGVYLSPWDRNHADYGKPEYITVFRNQLRELLTNYGDVFEVWFDGANGGTGYYGGANEERKVDKLTYYDWENTIPIIRELQPNAMIFSDAGPDVRWVGNEHGHAYPTTWSNIMGDSVYGGQMEYANKWSMGQENGTHWIAPEANVSIRPGWYYHPYEDHKVKSLAHLLDMYYESLGQNATFLLNFPVDKRGLIHENDIAQLQKLTAKLKEDFAINLAKDARATATNIRGMTYEAYKVLDDNKNTYWTTEEDKTQESLMLKFENKITFNRFLIQEYIALGQRIKAFTVEIKTKDGWQEIANETTIGYQRILRFPEVTTSVIRLNIKAAKGCPVISNIEIYNAPKLIVPPTITRNNQGVVTIKIPEKGIDIYYSTDGTAPDENSKKYTDTFTLHQPAVIQAIAISNDKKSEISQVEFDFSAINWSILNADKNAKFAIDGNSMTHWESSKNEIIIDLGEVLTIKGFTYLPMQQRWISGFIQEYEFYTSLDNKKWTLAKEGEFSNILNSPILQRVEFETIEARFIKLESKKTVGGENAAFGEVEVITR